MHEPTIHILKYRLLNQSFCIGPALTTNSQKHSSVVRKGVSTEMDKRLELTRIAHLPSR